MYCFIVFIIHLTYVIFINITLISMKVPNPIPNEIWPMHLHVQYMNTVSRWVVLWWCADTRWEVSARHPGSCAATFSTKKGQNWLSADLTVLAVWSTGVLQHSCLCVRDKEIKRGREREIKQTLIALVLLLCVHEVSISMHTYMMTSNSCLHRG